MKVVFASVSAVLLGSIPTALSAESNLRGGAALVTDFEDQAADLIGLDGDTDEDDKEAKKEEKLEKEWKKYKKAVKECKDLTRSDCVSTNKCGWNDKKSKCETTEKKPKFAEDEEDFYFGSSEDLFNTEDYTDIEKAAKKLEKKLKSYEKDLKTYDKLRKAFKNAEKECKDLTESDCDVATTCGWNAKKEKCVTSLSAPKEPKKPKFAEDEEDFYFGSSEDLFDTEDYDWDEDAEDESADLALFFDSEDYDFMTKTKFDKSVVKKAVKKVEKKLGEDADKKDLEKAINKEAKKIQKKIDAKDAKDLAKLEKEWKEYKKAVKECKDLTLSDCVSTKDCGWNEKKNKCETTEKKPKFAEDE